MSKRPLDLDDALERDLEKYKKKNKGETGTAIYAGKYLIRDKQIVYQKQSQSYRPCAA